MGCATAIFSRAGTPIVPTIRKLDELRVGVFADRANISATISRERGVQVGVSTSERPQVKVGIVCSIPEKWIIRFAQANLVWDGDTNREGVILYNTLISTDEWSLEEIQIEELL